MSVLESVLEILDGSRHLRRSPGRRGKRLLTGGPASDGGFTFLEVLVVLVVIGLLIAMTVGSIQTTRQAYQIYTAGITFSNRLAEARTQALKRNRPIAVTLDSATRTLTTTYTPAGGAPVTIAGPEYLPGGVVFDLGGAATLVVTFDSMGRPLNPPQTFQLRHTGSGQVRTLTVVSTGRITLN